MTGLAQAVNAAPSRAHRKPAPAMAVKANVALVLADGLEGLAVIVGLTTDGPEAARGMPWTVARSATKTPSSARAVCLAFVGVFMGLPGHGRCGLWFVTSCDGRGRGGAPGSMRRPTPSGSRLAT